VPVRLRRYRWEWRLQASPEALWPLVADTNRFNRDTGLPMVERLGPGRLRFRRYAVRIEWDEEPFEWVRPERFGVVRRYRRGPLAEMRILVELVPSDGGTLVRYDVEAQPHGFLGAFGARFEIAFRSRRRFQRVFSEYDRAAVIGAPLPPTPARLAHGARERLAQARARLETEVRPELAARLAETVELGDALELARLRPYALADAWGTPRREVLELCLRAVRAGMLDLGWYVLCPQCRGPAQRGATLADLRPGDAHCESCGIRFDAEFDRSVEVGFRPNPSIREVEEIEFCIGGPQVTPHVVAQQLVPARSVSKLHVPLEPGRYRLRSALGNRLLSAEAGGSSEPDVKGCVGLDSVLQFENPSDAPQVVVLERTAWSDQAATAADISALQLFRDLFAREALRPGEQLAVGSLAVLFTDLRDSTRFYREVGDAPAFGAVMSHLDVLRRIVDEEEGAVVKTMGDAVMAVFSRPAGAVQAALRAHEALPAHLVLKAGVHVGPCIAVTQNERLDYFGSTVNAAARLVGLSTGEDVVVSDAVFRDAEVAEIAGRLAVEPVVGELKGFDERFDLWRLRAV
jgi:class 3 adenylate cyclase